MENVLVKISAEDLSLDEAYDFILDKECGGNCLFIGTARNKNKGEEVTHLDFESYEPMALKEMDKICAVALERFNIKKIAVFHRSGEVALREIAVIIAVSAMHRAASFQACSFAIDELKKSVPIWKKEFLIDGSHWVGSRP